MPTLNEMDVPVLDIYAGPGYVTKSNGHAETPAFDQADIDAVVRAVDAIPTEDLPPLFDAGHTKLPTQP
jgi:hypothetical protein